MHAIVRCKNGFDYEVMNAKYHAEHKFWQFYGPYINVGANTYNHGNKAKTFDWMHGINVAHISEVIKLK